MLEDVARTLSAALFRVGRRENLVILAADRLENLLTAKRGVLLDSTRKFGVVHVLPPLSAYI
jgi:hypothetical protein